MSRNRYFEFIVIRPGRMNDRNYPEKSVPGPGNRELAAVAADGLWKRLSVSAEDAEPSRNCDQERGVSVNPGFALMLRALLVDFPVMGVEAMVEKYRLFGGWE